MTFHEIFTRWQWKPIRNCPGRFVLVTGDNRMPVSTLLGAECTPRTHSSDSAKDPVIVVALDDGGLISYARPDGCCVHTLNTAEGFARKLAQLKITPKARQAP
ncbi:MAG: hypothetical protein ACREJU_13585 [Nitrospiraceae bacterium]